ncbi:MAG: hypothetical protein HZA91_13170 [Verrucomicrobia bacterium]|nr:hypothetical protein [Verrucomicrobiota bacterium]
MARAFFIPSCVARRKRKPQTRHDTPHYPIGTNREQPAVSGHVASAGHNAALAANSLVPAKNSLEAAGHSIVQDEHNAAPAQPSIGPEGNNAVPAKLSPVPTKNNAVLPKLNAVSAENSPVLAKHNVGSPKNHVGFGKNNVGLEKYNMLFCGGNMVLGWERALFRVRNRGIPSEGLIIQPLAPLFSKNRLSGQKTPYTPAMSISKGDPGRVTAQQLTDAIATRAAANRRHASRRVMKDDESVCMTVSVIATRWTRRKSKTPP